VADHGDYGVFLRRTIGHGIDGVVAVLQRPSYPRSLQPFGWRQFGIGGAGGGAMVEAVAANDALLAAWIGIPA